MGKLSNLTVKGQVTIPKDVRDALGLKPGEPVEIEWRGGDEAVIRKPRIDRDVELARIRARMEAALADFVSLQPGRPTDEIMRDIRGDEYDPA
ncbi:AbrB/MazE/SpoVT family DNA-binding domain-containing protein [Sphingomonas sanxanigenens]|uniref:SpoVT-AbrB domain-containing protein n=1 Tax=Sphingomonas sanxanigenens DSM 19645 = NX02 TaxID=1123269 RepID=W0A8S6_9SPHN|nr:AbrB/MazE/SpoVT family DNA-binding domain-containing protein [Sphingomonas sanxanigenens]AHE52748.1 hypothetical protein NX02_05035 [Sphingomonas sanxanigenens DSM 19645 = NX02]